MKEYVEFCATWLTKISLRGNEKSSFRLALFKSLYSIHNLIFLLFLGTITILDTHCRYLTTKNPASHYFVISSFTLSAMSGRVLCGFFFTGVHHSFNGILCTTMSVSRLDISA